MADKIPLKGNREGGNIKVPRPTKVKNKSAAPLQITAEQILREAMERQEADPRPPKQKITDPEELADYRLRKRKAFEDIIRRQRHHIGTWLKYASWEESQKDFERARSVYERTLDVDYRNVGVWLKYVEMEMRHKHINEARNIWDRAVTLLPRVEQMWYKYCLMEEALKNFAGTRQLFERWMKWFPEPHAWNSYIKFELRHGEIQRAREIYERYVVCHPKPKIWIKYAKFEQSLNEIQRARQVFERAVEYIQEGIDEDEEKLYIAFAQFEERIKEMERAREIYKYAIDHIPKQKAKELFQMFMGFEKKYGQRDEIEDVIVSKKRFQYEEELKSNNNKNNYDLWFDYIRLEEENSREDLDKIREVYERSIAQVPPKRHKRFWRRYIYLWINYWTFEELIANDIERTRTIFQTCIKLIPHASFSFSKVWIMFAQFELRQKNLDAARKIFGQALGLCQKDKIYVAYIELENKLGNIDRCRILYQKWIERKPENSTAWIKFAQLEATLWEQERARNLFELAIAQPVLDMPELAWKAYIDFEIESAEFDLARALYRRLLEKTKHVKVWISFAQFEYSIDEIERCRALFQEGFKALRPLTASLASNTSAVDTEIKEERVTLLQAWGDFEKRVGDAQKLADLRKLQPKRVLKKRRRVNDDGSEGGWEEYYDYLFPDDLSAPSSLKILEAAHKWKKQKVT